MGGRYKTEKEHRRTEDSSLEHQSILKTILNNTPQALRLLSSAVEQSSEGIAVTDLTGNLLFVNNAFAAAHGYTPEELIGQHLSIFHTSEQLLSVEAANRQIQETGEFSGEIGHVRRDGTIFPTLMRNLLLRDEDGKPIGMIGTVRDITELKQAEAALQKAYDGLERQVEERTAELVMANEALRTEITERRQMEEELRESEDRYRAIVNLGADVGEAVVMLQDTEEIVGQYVYVSDEWTRITGYSREELLGISQADLINPEYRAEALARHQRRMKGESIPGLYEISIIRKDGTEVPVELTAAYTTYQGKPAHVVYMRDITERKQAEIKIERVAQEWRTTFDSISDSILIQDRDAKIIRANMAFARTLNMKIREVIGKTCYELIHGEEKCPPDCPHRRVVETGKSSRKEFFEPHLGIHIEDTCLPIFDERQEVTGAVHIVRDITERKRAEVMLRQSEENLRRYLEDAPFGILLIDLRGVFLYGNKMAEKISGYKRQELVGKNFFKVYLLPRRSLLKAVKLFTLNKLGRMIGPDELELIRKEGSRVWVEVTATPVKQVEKKVVLCFVNDISERRRLRANLLFYITEITKAQEEERKRIARELHDETAQSLAALALDIQDIETRHLSQENVQRLEKLRAKVDDILHGVRRFSHELRPEILDHLGLIPTLELLVSELNEGEKIKARFKVTGYRRRLLPETELALFRIAQEAISNIRKYSRAKRVLIELAFTRRKTKMKIGDNGIGFNLPEEIGDLASLGKLGLIGMKERARIIDGDLTVKSSPNQGTTVTIELAE